MVDNNNININTSAIQAENTAKSGGGLFGKLFTGGGSGKGAAANSGSNGRKYAPASKNSEIDDDNESFSSGQLPPPPPLSFPLSRSASSLRPNSTGSSATGLIPRSGSPGVLRAESISRTNSNPRLTAASPSSPISSSSGQQQQQSKMRPASPSSAVGTSRSGSPPSRSTLSRSESSSSPFRQPQHPLYASNMKRESPLRGGTSSSSITPQTMGGSKSVVNKGSLAAAINALKKDDMQTSASVKERSRNR